MFKKLISSSVGLVLIASPLIASAQSLSDITAQLQSAIAKLQFMQASQGRVLGASTTDDTPNGGSSGYYCPQLTQTLKRGSRDATTGGQVTELQTFLTDYFNLDETTSISGFFGKTTQKYVVQFQQEYDLPAFGIVGSLTRAKIAEVCAGSGGGTTNPSVIFSASPASGNAPLLVNLSANLQGIKTGPTAGDIRIEFTGETDAATICRPSMSGVSACPTSWTGTHTFSTPGTWKAMLIQCPDNNANACEIGFTILDTAGVTVGDSHNQTSITVLSPNGGETLDNSTAKNSGIITNITWVTKGNNPSGAVEIDLVNESGYVMKTIASNVRDMGSATWYYDPTLAPGKYKILVSTQDKGPTAQDYSDGFFTVTSGPRTQPTITSTGAKAAGNFEADAGGDISIYGSNLATVDSTKVFIGGISANVTWTSDTTVVAKVPSTLTPGQSYDLYLINQYGKSNVVSVKILSVIGSI